MIILKSKFIRSIETCAFLASAILLISLISCAGEDTAVPTETPTQSLPTETPLLPSPTNTPLPSLTPEPTMTTMLQTDTPDPQDNCIPFEELSQDHVGEIVCVYGVIVRRLVNDNYAAILRFSDSIDYFLFRSRSYYWTGIEIGDCISMTGEIIWNGTYYYIEVDEQGEGAEVGYTDQCQ